MKTTVINLEGIESVLSPAGVEKQLCKRSGIHSVETNFMTGTATVRHDASVTMSEIKGFVADCGYRCSGECMPEHVVKVHEMGHGGGMSMKAMMLDMRNRFLISFMLAIPVFLYSPLFTQVFKVQLPLPFGLSNEVLSFLLATPAVLYGGWVFYVGAWHGLKNRTLNMAVLVSLSVLAGYLFSVAATFLFEGEVFYEAAAMLLAFVLFGHWMEMRARSNASQAIQALINLAPPKATVFRDGQPVERPTSELVPNDIVLIRPGDKIPVDGLIIEGASNVLESTRLAYRHATHLMDPPCHENDATTIQKRCDRSCSLNPL